MNDNAKSIIYYAAHTSRPAFDRLYTVQCRRHLDRYSTITVRGSCTTRPTFVDHCSRRSSNSGASTQTRWSRVAGWRILLTVILRRRSRHLIVWISTRTASPMRRSWSGSASRKPTRTANSTVGTASGHASGRSSRSQTHRPLPRSVGTLGEESAVYMNNSTVHTRRLGVGSTGAFCSPVLDGWVSKTRRMARLQSQLRVAWRSHALRFYARARAADCAY